MSAVRRVLMSADTVGGVWTYAVDLARAFGRHGVQVVLATMGRPLDRDQQALLDALPNVLLRESTYALEWMDDPWDDVTRAGDWLLGLEAEHRPDVVHLNAYAHGALPFDAPKVVVGHSCVCSWWEAVLGEDTPPRFSRYRRAVRDGLRGAHRIVAPTAALLDRLAAHHGPLPHGEVIHNGTFLERFRADRKEPFLLAVGRLWDQAKNLAILERLAPRLPWPIRVVGETARPGGGDRTCHGVTPLGRLPHADVAALLSRAAIFVHPARYEPFGLAPLEAAASGCALVLGDIPSLREVWRDAAVFVPPDDLEALTAAVEDLVARPEHRRRLAEAARRRARAFDIDRTATATLGTYARAAAVAELTPALASV